jgi:calcineurin-like phosphoesterase family protein
MKLILTKEQTLYFTSDTHYNHRNLCSATTEWVNAKDKTREFSSLDEMNDTIVNNINSVVRENDILIHLGDWSFGGVAKIGEFRNRLNCKTIHLLLGNHDHHIQKNTDGVRDLFTSINQYIPTLGIRRPSLFEKGITDKFTFTLFHFPIASWDGMNDGGIHLHGHCHLPPEKRVARGRAMDVGMDGNGMFPISLDEVLSILSNRPIKSLSLPQDHHEE